MALIKAAKKGSLEDIEKIVSSDPSLIENEKDKTGSNALIYACYYGHYPVAKYLIDHGANKEVKNTSGSTPLMTASKNNHCAIMDLLLEKGANIDGRSKWGNTALMTAARNGHVQAVQFLLEKGANVWAKCEKGLTAGEVAWREEIKEILKSYEDGHPITRKSGRFAAGPYAPIMSYGQSAEGTPASSPMSKSVQSSTPTSSKSVKYPKSPAPKKPAPKATITSNSSVSSVSSINSRMSISSRNSVSSAYMTPRKTASISSINTNTTVPIHRSTPQRSTPAAKTPQTPTNANIGIQAPSWETLFLSIRSFEQWHQYHMIHLQYQEAMTHDQYYVAKTLLDQLHKVQAAIAAAKKEQTVPTDASLVSFDDLDSEIDKYSTNSISSHRNSLKPDALKSKSTSIMSPSSPLVPASPSQTSLVPTTTYRGINEYLQIIFNFQKDLLTEKSKLKELCKQQVIYFPLYEQCHVYLHVMNVYAAQVMSLQQSLLQQFSRDGNNKSELSNSLTNVELTPVWEQCFVHVQSILQKHHTILTSLLYQKAIDSNDTTKASAYYDSLVSEHAQREGENLNGQQSSAPNVQHVFQHVSQYYHHLLSLRKELLVFQQLLQQIVKFHIKYFQHWKLCQELLTSLNQMIIEVQGKEDGCEGGAVGESILDSPGGVEQGGEVSGLESGFVGKWMSGGQWVSLWRNDVNEVAAYDQSVKSEEEKEEQFITY